MTRSCSNSRFNSILSILVAPFYRARIWRTSAGLLLALCLYIPGLQAEIPLRAFTATYALKIGSLSPATAELSLEPFEKMWRWRLITQAKGIYAVFIRKQPYSETLFKQTASDPQLQSILITDDKKDLRQEYASFDWEAGQMQVLRKGKNLQQPLTEGVYDYQSIHLLAADMQLREQQSRRLLFYYKGNLVGSELTYVGDESVEINGKQTPARLYLHTFDDSRYELRYYYEARNPLLPLLIKRFEEDESPSTLTLQKVDWRS